MRLVLLVVAALVGAFIAAVFLMNLPPPAKVTFAAGAPGSAYHAVAERYRALLAEDDITVEIIETAGSVENVAALSDGADVALVQGGIPVPPAIAASTLAGVFIEPLLVFARAGVDIGSDPARWDRLQVAIGPEGSGTRAVVLSLLDGLDLPLPSGARALGGGDAAAALISGEIDVAIYVAPFDAPYLAPLLGNPSITLMSPRDAAAIQRYLPVMDLRPLPRGALDYAKPLPAETITLVTTTTRLIGRADLHPAVIDRLIKAAMALHGDGGLLSRPGDFPAPHGGEPPMNQQAENLLTSPPSTLDRYIPYWIAAQINKVALLLVPAVILLLPLARLLPGIYRWQMRARVYKRYPELIAIETEADTAEGAAALARLEARLDAVEDELVQISLPESYREYAYSMRMHIDLVRKKLRTRAA